MILPQNLQQQLSGSNFVSEHKIDYSHLDYRADIDGLRGIAVLAVVFFHAFPNLFSGGFVGVDIFFVISGYLITSIIINNLNKDTFLFTDFYSRRIRRIFPAVILVLASCFIFGWFALYSNEFKNLGKHIAAGAGFVSNIALWSEASYFDNSSQTKPLIHLWSLGIEEQFYIIWPFFLWLLHKYKFNFLIIFSFFTIFSFILNAYNITQDSTATFYSPLTRFWELLSGSLLALFIVSKKKKILERKNNVESLEFDSNQKNDYQIYKNIAEHSKWIGSATVANLSSIIGFLVIFYSIFIFNKKLTFPGYWALLPVVGTTLIILAGSKTFINRIILSNKIVVWFGLVSFPLYLWHWPLLSFANIIQSEVPNLSIRIAFVAISILLAWLTYKFIERPFRFGKNAKVKVSILVIFMVIIGCIGFKTYQKDGLKNRSTIESYEIINAHFHDIATRGHWEYYQNESCKNRYFLSDFKNYPWFFCVISSEKKPTILILGDSNANDFYPGIILNKRLNHHTVLSIGSCDPAWIDEIGNWSLYIEKDHPRDGPCWINRQILEQKHINNLIIKEKSIKFVILGGLNPNPTLEYAKRLKRRIDFLEANQIKVILTYPKLQLNKFNPKFCYSRPFVSAKILDCSIPIQDYLDQKKIFLQLAKALAITNPNIKFFDPNMAFCNNEKCKLNFPTFPVYRDTSLHYSIQASIEIFDTFVKYAIINLNEIIN